MHLSDWLFIVLAGEGEGSGGRREDDDVTVWSEKGVDLRSQRRSKGHSDFPLGGRFLLPLLSFLQDVAFGAHDGGRPGL